MATKEEKEARKAWKKQKKEDKRLAKEHKKAVKKAKKCKVEEPKQSKPPKEYTIDKPQYEESARFVPSKVKCIETDKVYDSMKQAAYETGVSVSSVSRACREGKKVKGLTFIKVD